MEDVAEKLHTLNGLASSSDRSTTGETGIGILWIGSMIGWRRIVTCRREEKLP